MVDRGVGNHQFLSLYWSDVILLLCRASQEDISQRSSGSFGRLWQLWLVEALKVGGTSRHFLTFSALEVDTGCGRLVVVWPPVVLSSWHFV